MAKSFSRVVAVAALSLTFAGCTPLDNLLAKVPYLAFMRNSPFFDPYEAPRPAPPGSIPYSSPAGVYMPPMEGTVAALDSFALTPAARNPYSIDDPAVLALGKKKYEQHCSVCHATNGEGNGPVVGPGKVPMGVTLLASTAPSRSDGYIYGIIRAGRGLMPAYGARTNHTERWAMATYVKHLQRQAAGGAATPAGAPAVDPAQNTATTGAQNAPPASAPQNAPAAGTGNQENR